MKNNNMNDIVAINKAAQAIGLSYGEYVKRYGCNLIEPPKPRKQVLCAMCGVDISYRYAKQGSPAKYCEDCADKRRKEQCRLSNERYRLSYKANR